MEFAKPFFLYIAIILVPLAFLFLRWAERRRQAAIARIGSPALVARISQSVNRRGRRWQIGLWVMAMVMVLVALARPQWGTETQEVKQQGIEVMVALDVSNSMLAQDIKPDRLTRAKLEISDLMDRLGGDEIGLVLFSGASFIQFPLTNDYATARSFLDNARPSVISKQGTNIGDAIRTALTGFDFDRSSQKVIVLITDGEDHEADTMAMAQQAADQGVLLYTIGFGSPDGEPIPEYDAQGQVTGYKTDQQGQVVLSKLDEATLQQIADVGHGRYFHAATDGSELPALVTELNTLQKGELSTQTESWGIERFQLFLWLGLIALLAAEFIPDRIWRKSSDKRAAMGSHWLLAKKSEGNS
ncbi:MAG: VWA domain-containing protein [Anaerolineae bacterium]|nr:VWA domain-containing protein [Anaerolineae bacterium]